MVAGAEMASAYLAGLSLVFESVAVAAALLGFLSSLFIKKVDLFAASKALAQPLDSTEKIAVAEKAIASALPASPTADIAVERPMTIVVDKLGEQQVSDAASVVVWHLDPAATAIAG